MKSPQSDKNWLTHTENIGIECDCVKLNKEFNTLNSLLRPVSNKQKLFTLPH